LLCFVGNHGGELGFEFGDHLAKLVQFVLGADAWLVEADGSPDVAEEVVAGSFLMEV
jgi:hypothetical protein